MSSYSSFIRRRNLVFLLTRNRENIPKPKPNHPNSNFDQVYYHSFFLKHHLSSKTISKNGVNNASLRSSTISYLVTNCGLSSKSALLASGKVKVKLLPERADAVVQILGDFGLSSADITDLVVKYPRLLTMKPMETLKAKLDCLRSGGLSDREITEILRINPHILLGCSLERKFIPFFRYLETIFPSKNEVINFLKYTRCHFPMGEVANIEILRSHGTPETIIARLFNLVPRSLFLNSKRFAEAAQKAREIGFDPSKSTFVYAVGILSILKKSTWERKCALFRSFGFSSNEVVLLFKRQPYSLALSDELIKKKINFFTKKLGWDTRSLVSCPPTLRMSLDRIIPRCSVLNVLMSKDLIKKETSVRKYLMISGNLFKCRYVDKYMDEAPEVVDAYKVNHQLKRRKLCSISPSVLFLKIIIKNRKGGRKSSRAQNKGKKNRGGVAVLQTRATEMIKVALVVLSQLGLLVSAAALAPRAPKDCDNMIVLTNIATCLDYVVLDSSDTTTPSKDCCDGLATTVKDTPICLCQFLNNNGGTYRLPISITSFVGLLGACKITTPPPTDCKKPKGPSPSSSPLNLEFHPILQLLFLIL